MAEFHILFHALVPIGLRPQIFPSRILFQTVSIFCLPVQGALQLSAEFTISEFILNGNRPNA
jgi:hypothetical protein